MGHYRLYPRYTTPAGRIVRMGDRYMNAQGMELSVVRIFSLADDTDVRVELLPIDLPLAGTCWQGELLMHCDNADVRIRAGEASARPCVYIEDIDGILQEGVQAVAAA